jgi:hypothetical protein
MFASGIFLHLRHRAEHELVEQWHGECHVAMRRAENHPFLNKLGSYRAKAAWRQLKFSSDDYRFAGGLGMIRRRLPPRPKGLGGAAGNDHQTAIPKTD